MAIISNKSPNKKNKNSFKSKKGKKGPGFTGKRHENGTTNSSENMKPVFKMRKYPVKFQAQVKDVEEMKTKQKDNAIVKNKPKENGTTPFSTGSDQMVVNKKRKNRKRKSKEPQSLPDSAEEMKQGKTDKKMIPESIDYIKIETAPSSASDSQIVGKKKRNRKRKNKEPQSRPDDAEEMKQGKTNKKIIPESSDYIKIETTPSSASDSQIVGKKKRNRKRKSKEPQSQSDDAEVTEEEAPMKKMKFEPSRVSSEIRTHNKNKRPMKPPHVMLSQDELKIQCHEYLTKWKDDKQNWKFAKHLQNRLIKNMFDVNMVPDEYFQTLLEYLAGASLTVKSRVKQLANFVISDKEKWDLLNDKQKLTAIKVDESTYERARNLVQYIV